MAISGPTVIVGTVSSGSTTAAVNFTGRSVGEYALVLISRNSTVDPTGTPAGWSLVNSHSSGYRHYLYGKLLESGDIGTVTWTWASGFKTLAHGVVCGSVDGTTPVDASAKGTFATGTAQTMDFGSLSTSEPFVLALCSCYATASRTYDVSSQGLTESHDYGTTAPDFWHYIGYKSDHGGGTFAPSTSTNYISVGSTYRGGFLVALKAATATADVLDPMGMSGFFGM